MIDIHTHFIPRECFDMVDDHGRRFGPSVGRNAAGHEVIVADGVDLGPVLAQVTDPAARLVDMDRIGLDVQVLSINPSSLFHDLPTELVSALYRRYNDAIAEVTTAHPDRFLGLATLPLQDPSAALDELDRSITRLGLHGVQFGSNVAGTNLDADELFPVFSRIADLDVPVFVHPYYVAAQERLSRYWLINLIGNPVDTSIAVASLVFGGVMERLPQLRVALAHGGGATPAILGRWDRGYRMFEMANTISRPPSDFVAQMYFDTLTHSDDMRRLLVDMFGAERVVLGSDYPFSMGDDDPVATLRATSGLSDGAVRRIQRRSAEELFGISL